MESTLNPTPIPVRKFNDSSASTKKNIMLGVISVVVVLAGIGAGYLFSGVGKNSGGLGSNSENTIIVSKNEAGISDESKFSTTTEGVLEEGGIGGEGTYHLVRGNGPSQYAYLTSSVVDLGVFVGKKVQIWGETVSGKKAGWLIDVSKIKVMEGE
ncbi:MAG: hypothetical protein ACD_19C00427G0006 [uncultured bacterium]|nr:MAG: hypothetical protein ACD_19C00427G0006 [uncultured bacterium]